MSGTFQLDGELFPQNPLEKRWNGEKLGYTGDRVPVLSGVWTYSLSFGLMSAENYRFYEDKFIAGGIHQAVLPHPISSDLSLFTGVYIDSVEGGFNDVDRNSYVTDVSMTLRVSIGSTGSF